MDRKILVAITQNILEQSELGIISIMKAINPISFPETYNCQRRVIPHFQRKAKPWNSTEKK